MECISFKSIAIEYCQKVALKVLQYQIQYWNLEILQCKQQYQKSIAITIAAKARPSDHGRSFMTMTVGHQFGTPSVGALCGRIPGPNSYVGLATALKQRHTVS